MAELPQSLVDAVRAGTLIPFVGAGVSVGAVRQLAPEFRFPDWKGLIEALAARLVVEGMPNEAAAVRATLATDVMAAAELAMQSLGRKPFLDVMERLFDRRLPREADLSLVSAIWRLRPPFIVTTNYDRVLEWPFGPGDVRAIGNDDPTYVNELSSASSRRRIWYLHGSIDRIDTIILTSGQYKLLYPTPNDPTRLAYENAARRFEDLLKTHAFLFIGYSLDEPLLRERLQQVRAATAQAVPMKYLLLRQGEADAAKIAELRDAFGVQVIEFANFGPPLLETVQGMRSAAWPGELQLTGPGLTQYMAELVRSLEEACRGAGLSTADVSRLYNAARPTGWEPLGPGTDPLALFSEALQRLGRATIPEQGPSRGIHPLLSFADRLKDELVQPALGRVKGWMDTAIDMIAPSPAEAALVRQALARARAAAVALPVHVLIRIAATTGAIAPWRVHAWAYTGSDPEALLGAEGMAMVTGGEGDLVIALVEAMEARQFDPEITSLSFLVPCALANAPIDQWQLPREVADDPPLGVTHLVTIRSLDRLGQLPFQRQRYKAAWTQLVAQSDRTLRILTPGAPPPPDAVYGAWVDAATARGGMLSTTLSHQSVRCVLLSQAPAAEDLAALSAVIRTPVPIVLWPRDPSIPFAQLELAVRAVVEAGAVADLPRRMRAHRAEALAAGATAVGRHLALLWDDADYLPPDSGTAAKAVFQTT